MQVTARTAGTAGNDIEVSSSTADWVWVDTIAGGTPITELEGGKDTDSVSLSAIPISPDTQVISRRIYRDFDGDAIYRFVTEIEDNTTAMYTDSTPFASLGVTPPIAGDDQLDNSPPPRFKDFIAFNGRIFGINADNNTQIHWSEPGEPEKFPVINTAFLEENLVAIRAHALGVPLLYGTDAVFALEGDGTNVPYTARVVNTNIGANGTNAVIKIKDINLTVRESEVFLVSNPGDEWLISGAVFDQFRALTQSTLDEMFVVHDRGRFRVLFFGLGDTTPLVYQYGITGAQQVTGDGRGISPQDLRMGAWFSLALPSAYAPQCAEVVEIDDDERPFVFVGGNDGYVYAINHPDNVGQTEVGGLSDTSVLTTITTNPIPIGASVGGLGEPRYIRLNYASGGATVSPITLVVSIFDSPDGDGTANASTNFTYTPTDVETRAPILAIPSLGRGRWATVSIADTSAVSGTLGIASLDLFFIPRGPVFGGESAQG
jgi:hypothetical protein